MPDWARSYVKFVEALNFRIGRFAMYLLFVMMAILIWSSITKIIRVPAIWTLEMAQFTLVAYYLLGAPYTFLLNTNVRMDLVYARLRPRTQAWWDVFTVFALLFYLGVMLPLSLPGRCAAFILSLVLTGNEYFFAALLTSTHADTLPVMVASQTGSQGISWWSMAALSFAAILPLLLAYAMASVGVEFATVFNNAMMPTLVPPDQPGGGEPFRYSC